MGIGSNLGVEIAEQKYLEALFEEVIYEAAALVVVEKQSRVSAYRDAQDLISKQHEALSKGEYSEDESSNTISFFESSLNGVTVPSSQKDQVGAVAKELRAQYESNFLKN